MEIAAVYMRLSREDRGKGCAQSESIQNQRMILDAYAAEHGWRIFDYYTDEDWSGSNRSRPEFLRMISDARAGRFNIVLVKTQSRFARDSKYIEDYIHNLFADNGIRFVSVVDNIDTDKAGSKLNSRVHAIFDEEQLDLLSSNIRRSFAEKAKQGQFFGSMPPYGYKKDPQNKNHLIIDEEAAEAVRLIFEMTAAGYTYLAAARLLNERGYLIPSEYKRQKGYNVEGMYDRRGGTGLWTRDIVRSFVTNEVYRGTIINHKSTVVNFRTKKKKNLPESLWLKCEHMHEAIISEELWNRVEEIRSRRRRACASAGGTKHPLSGTVFCGVCGSQMHKCKSGGIEYFRCYRASSSGACKNSRRIRLDYLENLLMSELNAMFSRYADISCIEKNIYLSGGEQTIQCNRRRAAICSELDGTRKKLKKLLDKYLNGEIDSGIYGEAQAEYLRAEEEYIKRLDAINAEMENLMRAPQNPEDIISRRTHIDKLTIPIVQEFIESVVVSLPDGSGIRDVAVNFSV